MGELIDGQPMFPGDNTLDQLHQIVRVLGPFSDYLTQLLHSNEQLKHLNFKCPENYQTLERRYKRKMDSEGLDLLLSLLEMDPRKRITASEALKHPYFSSMHGEDFLEASIKQIKEKSHLNEFKENSNINKISLTNLKVADKPTKNFATLYLKDSSNSPMFNDENLFGNTLTLFKVCHN